MLFLTRGQLYHAETWRHWFREAEGLIPYSALPAGACSNLTAAATATAASSPAPAAHRRALMDWPRWTGAVVSQYYNPAPIILVIVTIIRPWTS